VKNALVVALIVASACVDFDDAFAQCRAPGGRCAVDASVSTGGGSAAGGGQTTGGGAATGGGTAPGGGTATGGGIATGGGTATGGGGGCDTCIQGGTCVPRGQNSLSTSCGTGGALCDDCTQNQQECEQTALVCASWQLRRTEQNHHGWNSVWAAAPDDVWFVNALVDATQFTGSGFVEGNLAVLMVDVFVNPTDRRVFVVGQNSGTQEGMVKTFLEPWDGGDSPGPRHLIPSARFFDTIFKAGPDVYIAGSGTMAGNPKVMRFDNGTWVDVTPTGLFGDVWDGFGVGANDYYLATNNPAQLVHVDATGTRVEARLPVAAYSIWRSDAGTVWFAGRDLLGNQFSDGGLRLLDAGVGGVWNGIWAPSDSNVVVAGKDLSGGRIARWNGVRLTKAVLPPMQFNAIHGTGPLDIWAADHAGGLWHYGP
jgi:hypothetical protein